MEKLSKTILVVRKSMELTAKEVKPPRLRKRKTNEKNLSKTIQVVRESMRLTAKDVRKPRRLRKLDEQLQRAGGINPAFFYTKKGEGNLSYVS